MDNTEKKLKAIRNAVIGDIEKYQRSLNVAMFTLEQMNIDPERYKVENIKFGISAYVIGYLKHVKKAIERKSLSPLETPGYILKCIENIIRFHCYSQHQNGDLEDGSEISQAQSEIATILDGYISKYFDETAPEA